MLLVRRGEILEDICLWIQMNIERPGETTPFPPSPLQPVFTPPSHVGFWNNNKQPFFAT